MWEQWVCGQHIRSQVLDSEIHGRVWPSWVENLQKIKIIAPKNWDSIFSHNIWQGVIWIQKKGASGQKLNTRSIMPETSPNSPHITLTHPKSRFDHFWDPPQPLSWSKLAICAKSGVVFLSGQESNPKVHGYREKFNIGNVAHIF